MSKYGKTIVISQKAHELLDEAAPKVSQDKKVLVDNALKWLFSQDEDIWMPIVGAMPESRRPEFMRRILEEMAAEDAEQPPLKLQGGRRPRQAAKHKPDQSD